MKKRNSSTEMKEWRRKKSTGTEKRRVDLSTNQRSAGVTKVAISQWMKRVEKLGEKGLEARPHPGSPTKLKEEEQRLLPEYLSHGADFEEKGGRADGWRR